jgi:uncharacterized protein YnzC (UPF0291/DUF896 family)
MAVANITKVQKEVKLTDFEIHHQNIRETYLLVVDFIVLFSSTVKVNGSG